MTGEEAMALFRKFKVSAMGAMYLEMLENPVYDALAFEEKVGLMLAAEEDTRRDRKVKKLVDDACFKLPSACVEEIVYAEGRGLDRDQVLRWANCGWVSDHENLVLIGSAGCGKSYLAQALGNAACRSLVPTRYVRLADMLAEICDARTADATGERRRAALQGYKDVDLLIIDDFLTTPVTETECVDLLEVAEGREDRRATLVASQLEPEEWFVRIPSKVLAGSIVNRFAPGGKYVDVDGPNMRIYLTDHARTA